MTIAYVGLGSNLGDRAGHLAFAMEGLRATQSVHAIRRSSLWETAPLGAAGQGPYLNAVARMDSRIEPRELLERLLALERERGRVRSRHRDEARTLDLDLLFFGHLRIEEPGLVVPHPRLHLRAFVLEPLCEIAPGFVHPVLGETVTALAARVHDPAAAWRFEEGAPAAKNGGGLP